MQIQELIKGKEYERLDEETMYKLTRNDDVTLIDMISNPIVLKANTSKELF